MAGTPLDSSSTSTPPGAVSPKDSLQTHDEHMEESDPQDPQATRKRPRLDSGSASREAMSTGESPVRRSASPRTPNPEEPPSLYRSASRVTINMISPSRPVVATDGGSDSPSELVSQENGVQSVANDAGHQLEDTTMVGAQSSTAISISSSPMRSPEIEVADLEDMDQDPNTSNWRPLGEAEALRDQGAAEVVQVHERLSLADSFPKIRGNVDVRESVEEIVTMIEKGELRVG
jgi:ubiquitin carboxyl-terminal hydrolase 34